MSSVSDAVTLPMRPARFMLPALICRQSGAKAAARHLRRISTTAPTAAQNDRRNSHRDHRAMVTDPIKNATAGKAVAFVTF